MQLLQPSILGRLGSELTGAICRDLGNPVHTYSPANLGVISRLVRKRHLAAEESSICAAAQAASRR
jgi:hypothetical protein